MKKYILILINIWLFTFTSNCQENDTLKTKMLNNLQLRNKALKTDDLKTLYFYSTPTELNKLSFEEFEKSAKDDEKSKVSFKEIEILEIKKIIYCNSTYQCILNLKNNMIINGDEVSIETKIIAISADGEDWKFINRGSDYQLKSLKKMIPNLCLSGDVHISE